MIARHLHGARQAALLASSLLILSLTSLLAAGPRYGRLSGSVLDTQGNPLMGATVLIAGPASATVEATVERVITDAQGKFTVQHLVPGWYSLQVTAPARLPALRNGVRVEAGQISTERFVLSDVFAPIRFQWPSRNVSSWGDDWKWVLRTSAPTRPILRYREVAEAVPKELKLPLPASRRLVGIIPGSTRRDPLAGDPGLGSVLAYLRPLSEDSDLLVAGSMTANGIQASSVATAFRRNLVKGNPQELTLVVHQLSFSDGADIPSSGNPGAFVHAQGLVVTYVQTRRISQRVSMTAGMEIDYLNAARDVMTTQPRLGLEYQVSPATVLALRLGGARADGSSTLLERVGMLSIFPRVTLRGYRPRLEQLKHAEVSLSRRLSKNSRFEIAAYQDSLHDAAVWGSGRPDKGVWPAGNFLPNPAGNGVILNAGDYRSSGLRAAYSQAIGSHMEALVSYAVGDALVANGSATSQGGLQGMLRDARSSSVAGKVSAQIPLSHTLVTTSYEWVQRDRVTCLDPYGQASLQLQPFLGIQIRQPLPTLAFLPARIEALADFRNLLAQGYSPLGQSGEKSMLLSSAYRSFRGGFSVQF
jgi:hypothetical protein